jgi:hypothetical protein
VDTRWLAKPTDIDTLVYGPTSDYCSANWPEVHGPYDLALKGGSDSTAYQASVGCYAYTFRTATAGPREIISADLTPGLNANQAASIELSASSTGPGTKDIDLYLQKWDGSQWQPIASSAGATATEYMKVRLPTDGRYRAQVFGYTVTNLPTSPVAADQVVSFTLKYDRFCGGDSYGVLMIGPIEAPGIIEVPVTVSGHAPCLYLPLVVRS